MKSKKAKKKLLAAAAALAVTLSMGMSASAETFSDLLQPSCPTESDSVILNYDSENNTYEFLDENENPIESDFSQNETESDENTVPESSEVPKTTINLNAKTTVQSDNSKTPAVTTAPRNWYVARYRKDAISSYKASHPITTVPTTTIKPPTTTPKTTTTTKPKTTTTTKPKTTTTTKPQTTTTKPKTTTTVRISDFTPSIKPLYKGIDVARFQGDIDWDTVKKSGINFVMIRAGYGMFADQEDMNFRKNIAGAQAAGIECGVYWYSYAVNTAEALQEAQVCHSIIKDYKISYPVAFDIEDDSQMGLSTTEISNITKIFCNYLESKNYYVTVYSFASMLNDKMNASVTAKYDIWVAHINVDKPNYSGNYGMWQYSHTGSVKGISTVVDLDYSYKNYPKIMKDNKLNGFK